VQVYTESQTFARNKAAEAWVKRRETELSEPGAIERAKRGGVLLRDVIDKYLAEVGQAQPLGRTKEYTLRAIAASYLGDMAPAQMTCPRGISSRSSTERAPTKTKKSWISER
jgi:hypothetical protein